MSCGQSLCWADAAPCSSVCRSKQTQAEAVKLKRIQKELQALDDMVSSDIGILRDRIEQASWEYCSARSERQPIRRHKHLRRE